MSIALTPVMTLAGLRAVFNSSNDGVQARITHVGLGDSGWAPDGDATALRHERNRITISAGSRIQPTQIHITAIENGATEYWVREIGFYLDDGTLLAVWSDPEAALAWKSADVDLLLAFDMVLSALPDDSVVVDGTGGVNLAPATTETEGVSRLASIEEARAGVITAAVVMNPASTRAHCDARYAQLDHRHHWNDLQGRPSSFPASPHSHTWSSITGRPASFPPTLHEHTWSSIQGRPATYPASPHNHRWSSIQGRPSTFTPSSHRHPWSEITERPSSFPSSPHNHSWSSITGRPSTFPPSSHNHDTRYMQSANFRMTSGFVRTNRRRSQSGWAGFNDWLSNYADVSPPSGFTMANLDTFFASIGIIYFNGNVNGDDILYCRWRRESNRVRVICANSENNPDAAGAGSYINYMAMWRR